MRKSQLHVALGLWCALAACTLGVAQEARPSDAAPAPARITDLRPTVILISIDGYRWDYPDKHPSPNLRELIRGGVRAEMIPSFPTKTFPNHYTLVTGLYPGNHGIVANTMWDDAMNAGFKITDAAAVTDARWWEGGEPIWVTANKQGQKSAAMFWPGSEAPIRGVFPDYWQKFDDKMPHDQRIRWVLEQLDRPAAERPSFNTLYFSAVDHAGHDFGPDAPETAAAVQEVDRAVGELVRGLKERGIFEQVNLIVVADHGMTPVSKERQVFLDDYVDMAQVQVVDWSPLAIRAKDGNHEALYRRLKKAPHLKVYRKADLPSRYHYTKSSRILPLIGVIEAGWTLTTRKRASERAWRSAGSHGFDPQERSMHAIFIAHGPNFQPAATLEPFENVHVYPAIAQILGLQPARQDGDEQMLRKIMRSPKTAAAAAR